MKFYWYPKCSTCQRAKKYLDNIGADYEAIHIVEEHPSAETLKRYFEQSDYDIKRFFNTSGMKYRELKLKDKLPEMTEAEKLALLGTDGMLVKRPLVVGDDFVLLGFKEAAWDAVFKK
ncbi:MAG: arsenate reductase family protein [Eubacteriales bacterium]|nr:arsenate reductase family protein [Eubacteriales bacterium]